MQAIAFYLLKMMICSGLLLLYYRIVLRNKQFHYYNRYYLLMTLIVSMLLPWLKLEWITWFSNNDKAIAFMQVMYLQDDGVEIAGTTNSFSWTSIVAIVCIIISTGMLATLALRILKIYRLKKLYPTCNMGDFDFINTDLSKAPFSFLNNIFWRNDIDLKDATGQQILQHELAHIKQKHTWDKLLMQIILSVFWMNPFYWFIQRELYLIHEFIADKKAVSDKDAGAFAAMLLKSQYGDFMFAPAQSFSYSPIKRRLFMLTTSKQPSYSYARRLMVFPLLILVTFLFAFRIKEAENKINHDHQYGQLQQVSADTVRPITIHQSNGSDLPENLLFIVDGKIKDQHVLTSLDPKNIQVLNVIKGKAAIEKYGEKGKNGAIEIVTKQESATPAITISAQAEPLYIVDGIEMDGAEAKSINSENIESINVLKGETATSVYGAKGKNGVILITTKTDNSSSVKTLNSAVTITQQSPAHFTGGKDAWLKFLQSNLKVDVPVKNGGAPGKYTVILSFIVDADGNLSEIKADNDPGFGTAQEAVRLMETSPKWVPAVKEGKNISSLTKQSITFVITEG